MRRNGIAKIWLILVLPCMVIALCLVVEISNLWIARAELETALEAAALSAVDRWGDDSEAIVGVANSQNARNDGVSFAAANTIRGTALALDDNYLNGAANQNDSANGELVFGAIISAQGAATHQFSSTTQPDSVNGQPYAVLARKQIDVPSVCISIFGSTPGVFSVQAQTVAIYQRGNNPPSSGRARLIRATQVN